MSWQAIWQNRSWHLFVRDAAATEQQIFDSISSVSEHTGKLLLVYHFNLRHPDRTKAFLCSAATATALMQLAATIGDACDAAYLHQLTATVNS